MPNTPNASIPYVPEGTLDPAAGLNLSLNVIDALLQPRVVSMSQTAPPGSPNEGDLYIPATPATGAWAGLENWLVRYVAEGAFWQAYEPGVNVSIVVNDEDGILYVYDPSSPPGWTQVQGGGGGGATAIDVGIFFPGGPPSSNQLIGKFVAARGFTFPGDFVDSVGHVGTNPTGSFAITVSVGGVSVGTITIGTGGAFTFTTVSNAPVSIIAGDVIEFEAPGSTDASVADIAFTLVGDL